MVIQIVNACFKLCDINNCKQDNSVCVFFVGTKSCLSHIVINQQLRILELLQC